MNTMTTNRAIWFSRHKPTPGQIADIVANKSEIVDLEHGMRLGSINLYTEDDVTAVLDELRAMVTQTSATWIVGVFPPPIQHRLLMGSMILEGARNDRARSFEIIRCCSSWNIVRPVEASLPMFEHKQFCLVGWLILKENKA